MFSVFAIGPAGPKEGLVDARTVNDREVHSGEIEASLAAAQRGDLSARWSCLEACRGYLRLIALRRRPGGPSEHDVSDIVQNTILAAWRGFPRFQGRTERQLRGWLRVILRNTASASLRRRRNLGDLDALDDPIDLDTPASVIARRNDDREAIESALNLLPEHYRRLIQLRIWDDLTFPEIGRQLGLSEDSARKLYVRAMARLRESIGPGHEPR